MTDNEIIKSMQCVIGNEMLCSECTYQKVLPFPSCRMRCAKNALDLINRQKEENESLKVDLAKCSIRLDNLYKTADEIKSEAIKEFAERLKDEMRLEDDCRYDCMNCLYECKGYVPLIDNLVKEMTKSPNKIKYNSLCETETYKVGE